MINLYPYDKNGRRFKGDRIIDTDLLPSEIVKIKTYFIDGNEMDSNIEYIPIELWAGFFGIEQNSENYAIKPSIGLLVKMDDTQSLESYKFNLMNENDFGITIRVGDRLPKVLTRYDNIHRLHIELTKKVAIEEWFYNLNIEELQIDGSQNLSLRQKREIKEHFSKVYFESAFTIKTKRLVF